MKTQLRDYAATGAGVLAGTLASTMYGPRLPVRSAEGVMIATGGIGLVGGMLLSKAGMPAVGRGVAASGVAALGLALFNRFRGGR